MSLPKITYKVINSTINSDVGFELTDCVFANVNTQYQNSVQEGLVQADYRVYKDAESVGVINPFKLMVDGKRVTVISYVIPEEIRREFNPEQFPLVEKRMISDVFGIDIANINICVNGFEVEDSVFA